MNTIGRLDTGLQLECGDRDSEADVVMTGAGVAGTAGKSRSMLNAEVGIVLLSETERRRVVGEVV
jgi:hypothetical protein